MRSATEPSEHRTPPLIPLRDFFRNPERTAYQISPTGEAIAFLRPYENRLNVWVQPVKGGEARQVTAVTERDITSYFWKSDQHILFLQDSAGDENFHLYSANPNGDNIRDLTPLPGVQVRLVDDLHDHPDDIIVALNQRNREIFDAYRLNVKTGELACIAENPGNIDHWVTDHKGDIRAATTTDGVNASLLYRDSHEAAWKTVLTTTFRESFSPQFFTFDNRRLYGVSNLGRDKSVAIELDLQTGREVQLLAENSQVDISALSYSRKRKLLTFATYTDWKTQRIFFDQPTKALYQELEQRLPGYEVVVTSLNDDETVFVVRTFSDRSLGAFYLYDSPSGELTKLADRAPWLPEDQLSEMKPIEYQARDGLTIHAYLTLPQGREPEDLPVVINPHGGPWHRDSWTFIPEVQFLANRGFAVMQMNFRGSTGYGRKFWEAGFKEWGGKMQDDITDGVHWLIRHGIADPERVAIYGASYGGYAVLEGLVKTPDLYAAGVDYVGVSNLFTFFKTIPPYWAPYLEMMYEMVGHPEKDKDWFQEHSPALNADKIVKPLLVAQGAKDPRVNINESNQIVEALRKRGVEVVYIVKENEGHGFQNEENRFDFYEAMEKFLNTHLRPAVLRTVH
ncbi:MAG TPA: S9 family peptidase [Chthoniobacterales bacterium]|nr:S9 family peptidase [Chthoniobacterales bacterium]